MNASPHLSTAPARSTAVPELLREEADLFACPSCLRDMLVTPDGFVCPTCSRNYPCNDDGIPLLFCPNEGWTERRDVTETVREFYEKTPFPNYDDLDCRESLITKAKKGIFASALDEQIPKGARVLEAGCGTGQLTNFLGMSWKRRVLGGDMCLHSLRLGNDFRSRFSIANSGFLQKNLFRPPFRSGAFDVVISNGVLHHTGDPFRGVQSLLRVLKPGGYILIGLYNHIGRLTTDLRRVLMRMSGDRLAFLDAHVRDRRYNADRKRAWFYDQYKNPHESKHSMSEVLRWFEQEQVDFLCSIPKIDGSRFRSDESLFEPHSPGTAVSRWLTEVEMLLQGGRDGALFIMVGRKRSPAGAEER